MSRFPQRKGFRRAPRGRLLKPVVELTGPMGFVYRRSCESYQVFPAHDRLMLVFPRGACVMEVRIDQARARPVYRVDRGAVLVVPARITHDDEGISPVYDLLALFPSDALLASVASELGLRPAELPGLQARCRKLRRGPALERLLQDYFAGRVLGRKSGRAALLPLERGILAELLGSIFRRERRPAAAPPAAEPAELVPRALRLIEAELFGELKLARIARDSGTSLSTLLRRFREELGETPHAYIKNRRLEEAKRLLQAGELPVGDVARLVGYRNFGAFSEAFRGRYRKSPRKIRRRRC